MTTLRPASPQTGNGAGRFSHRPHTSPASHEMRQNTAPHRRKGAMPTASAPYADGIGTGRKQSNRKPHDGSRPSVTRSAPVTADRRPPTDGAPIYSGRMAIDMRPAATMTDKKIPRPKRSRDFSHWHFRMYPSAHYAVLRVFHETEYFIDFFTLGHLILDFLYCIGQAELCLREQPVGTDDVAQDAV